MQPSRFDLRVLRRSSTLDPIAPLILDAEPDHHQGRGDYSGDAESEIQPEAEVPSRCGRRGKDKGRCESDCRLSQAMRNSEDERNAR